LDKFEARSVDGIFFGYASHSRAYRVLNLETNQIMETCEVTFDETQPRSQLVFECAGDDEFGEEIFQEEEHEHGDDEDGGVVPSRSRHSTVDHGDASDGVFLLLQGCLGRASTSSSTCGCFLRVERSFLRMISLLFSLSSL
jgi:hypothetical protein